MLADEGRQQTFDPNSIPGWVYVAGAVLVVVVLLVALIGGWLVYRRMRRSGTWRRTMLNLQAEGMPAGPRRELAELRLELDQALGDARGAITALDAGGGAQGDLASLVRRLEAIGGGLSAQLDVLGRTVQDDGLAAMLPSLAPRVADVQQISGRICAASAASMGGAAQTELEDVTGDVRDELTALDAGVTALKALSADVSGA